jgi:hypothetical protein
LAASGDNQCASSRVVTDEAAKAMPIPALGNAQTAFEFRDAAAIFNLLGTTATPPDFQLMNQQRPRSGGSPHEQAAELWISLAPVPSRGT